jgi:hypothetical protein
MKMTTVIAISYAGTTVECCDHGVRGECSLWCSENEVEARLEREGDIFEDDDEALEGATDLESLLTHAMKGDEE